MEIEPTRPLAQVCSDDFEALGNVPNNKGTLRRTQGLCSILAQAEYPK